MVIGKRKLQNLNRSALINEEEAADNSSSMASAIRRWSQEEIALLNKDGCVQVDAIQLGNPLGGCAQARYNKSMSLGLGRTRPVGPHDGVDLKRVNDFLRLLIVNH